MAKTEHYYTSFEEGQFYHIYNRSIDKQPLFRNEGNYRFFLKQYEKYLSPVIETYTYCLLGNHFHMLIRVKENLASDPGLIAFQKMSNLPLGNILDKTPHDLVSHQFRKFFQSYAMAFNKEHNRVGTIFQTPFKRVLVNSEAYFTQLVYYIHANPLQHNLIKDFREWKWSSYNGIISEKTTKLKKDEVIAWFGDKTLYIKYHAELQKIILEGKFLVDN